VSSRYDATIDIDQPNNTHAALVLLTGMNRRVLELGAASGYMTRALRERGNDVTAIEGDPAAADDLKQIADFTIVGDLNDPAVLDSVAGPFDIVLAGDVLEHLLDPLGVLRAAVNKLAPDGAVVISIPNVTHIDLRLALLQGRFDYQPTGLLDSTHIRFFTYESLIDLLDEAGLLVTDIQRIKVNAFESEITVDRDLVSQDVLDAALGVPESETYQFVIRAVIDHGEPEARKTARDVLQQARDAELRRCAQRAEGPIAVAYSEQLRIARQYLEQSETDREALRVRLAELTSERDVLRHHVVQLDAHLEELRRDLDAARRELDVARRELVSACIAEARARTELSEQREALSVATHRAERALTDQQLLAEITGSRAYHAIARYRRAVNRLIPPGSVRRIALRPFARMIQLR
jgi:2-polyprenyl-3-methyl-5-hydroxy-6-metoxy-1,4-benzoquinol methylase